MKRFGFLSRLSADPVRTAVCLYALSILWWFLFPLLSISTGELKARGLYVDENALLVNSGSVDFRAGIDSDGNDLGIEGFNLISETVSQQHLTQDSLCSHLRNQFTSLTCVNSEEKYERRRITQIVVDHPWKPKSLEVSVVVIAYHSSNVLQSFAFTTALVSNLVSSDWLAKTVTILLVPVSCSEGELSEGDICTNTAISHQADEDILQVRPTIRYSQVISPWLDRYHSSPRNTGTGNGNGPFMPSEPVAGALHGGLLRDAYIIDFSEPFITSQLLNQSVGNGAKSDNSKRMHWDKIQLLVSGNNGQLPNMDFLSAPLASFPHITVSEADDLSQSRSAGKHREWEGESESIEGEGPVTVGLTDLCSWSGLFSEAKCNHYFTTLFGLIRFTSSMVEGPSGLHGQFIRRNVDAMTIRPHRKISTAAEAKRSRGGRKSNRVQSEASVTNSDKNNNIDTWATGDLSRLVDMVGYFLHISSNLHEELHHSQWFYLLMGSKLFVGLSEYVPTILLALAPLLLLYFRLAYSLEMPLQRRKKTNCAHSADQQEEKLTNQIQTMNDENPGIVVIHWPLMYGWMRFIGENVCVCTTVLILQPHLDISPSSLWSEVVLAVFLCNCCIIVTAEIWVGSLSLSPDVGQSISNSAPQDLTAYCAVMAATLILGLMWVAAQHYSLALPLILAIVPAVCVSCVCGVNLGALSLNVLTPTNILIHAPATNTTTTAVSSSESLVGDTGLSSKHETVCGIQNSNGAVVDCNTDINNCTDIDIDNKIEEFIALKSTSDRDTNGVHENSNEIELSAINCTNSSSSSSMIDRTANNTVNPGVDQGLAQGLLDDHINSTTDNRSEKISNSNTQSQPTSNNLMLKTISRCILYFIFFLGSPIGVQCVVFYLKCLAQLPTALSLLTLTLDPVHMLHDSDLYLKGLMALWIAPEISSIVYPVVIIFPQLISYSCLRMLLADAAIRRQKKLS